MTAIAAAVEGITDEAVARRLIRHVGAYPGIVYGKQGKAHLRERIQGYNNAARRAPWLVIVDLDREADCAPPFCQTWVPDPSPLLCFRVAVRSVEAWLMADTDALAEFLRISRRKVPAQPESVLAPKREFVNLARESRNNAIRSDMVPRVGSGRAVGPAYASRVIEFVSGKWDPGRASARSESLRRAIDCLAGVAALL